MNSGDKMPIPYPAIRPIDTSSACGSASTIPSSVRAEASVAWRSLSRHAELGSASMVPVPRTDRAGRDGAALLHIGLGFIGAEDAETSSAWRGVGLGEFGLGADWFDVWPGRGAGLGGVALGVGDGIG